MTKKFGPKLKNGSLSNLPLESLKFYFLYVLFRRFSIRQRHITSDSPYRSPCIIFCNFPFFSPSQSCFCAVCREKVLIKPNMDLEELTKLVCDHEAMELINASLKTETTKPNKPASLRRRPCPQQEKINQRRKQRSQKKTRKKLPDEAYKVGCWCFGAQHSRSNCKADRSGMVCDILWILSLAKLWSQIVAALGTQVC